MAFTVEEAIEALSGPNRAAAAEVLGHSGDRRALLPLIEALGESNADECRAIAQALGMLGDPRAAWALRTMLSSPEGICRAAAAEALGRLRDVISVWQLLEMLGDEDAGVREAAARALGEVRNLRAIPKLARLLGDRRPEIRSAAAMALGGTPDVRRTVSYLRRIASGEPGSTAPVTPDWEIPPEALLSAVPEWTAGMRVEVSKALDEALDSLVRWPGGALGLLALRDLDDPRAVLPLIEALRWHRGLGDRSEFEAVLDALAHLGPDRVVQPLLSWALRNVATQHVWPFGEGESLIADPGVRRLLAGWPEPTLNVLLRVLDPADIRECKAAADLLRRMGETALPEVMLALLTEGTPEAVPRLAALASVDPDLRTRVVERWVNLRRSGIEPLGIVLERGAGWVPLWAAEALGRIGGPKARQHFLGLWEREGARERLTAAVGLGHLKDARGLGLLLKALGSAEPQERLAVAVALGGLREAGAEGLGALRAMQGTDPDRGVAAACRDAIRAIEAALRGARTELEAATAPAGRGTELASAPAPPGPRN